MKENEFKFRLNQAVYIEMTSTKAKEPTCGSAHSVSEEFRKMLDKTLRELTTEDELIIHVMLVSHAAS